MIHFLAFASLLIILFAMPALLIGCCTRMLAQQLTRNRKS